MENKLHKAIRATKNKWSECPACHGPGLPLGVLGNRRHFRCQNCGIDFSRQIRKKPQAQGDET